VILLPQPPECLDYHTKNVKIHKENKYNPGIHVFQSSIAEARLRFINTELTANKIIHNSCPNEALSSLVRHITARLLLRILYCLRNILNTESTHKKQNMRNRVPKFLYKRHLYPICALKDTAFSCLTSSGTMYVSLHKICAALQYVCK
jgi:hypothetical protein